MDLAPGTRLADLYTVHGLLGEGGMASVYLVQDDAGTPHALKILRTRSASVTARLRREGAVQAQLDHPNVLAVGAVIALADRPALVLEYVPGPDLAELLAARSPSVAEAVAIARGILAGVQHAHDAGVVHRDLKPGNILLAAAAGVIVPKVADFGLVKVLGTEGNTRTGQTLGTPRYMPPEQIDTAHEVDARADVFSVGAILYELFCGRPAFTQTHLWSLMAAIGNGEFTAPDDLADLPSGLGALITACLAPAPADRPPSCAAVVAGLPDLPAAFDAATLDLVEVDAARGATPTAVPAHSTFAGTLAPYPSLAERPPVDAHGLPRERDPFVGRVADLAGLAEALQGGARLVTVLGAGGSGKTRLVTHFAWAHGGVWPGGVRFVDLVEARDADGIVTAVADTLGLLLGTDDPVARIGRALAALGDAMVVLDNFEQVVAHARQTVLAWRDRAPDVRWVVTSRQRLDLPGERVLQLDPLPPVDACALFVRRATDAGARLDPADTPHIDALVRRLDGLPLAIELAAARARAMSPRLLLARLDRRFRLLVAQGRTGRQRAMRAALDWSWRLLPPDERAALAQLAVFEGGFTLDAVEAVVELAEDWPEDAVQALVDKSLVQRGAGDRLALLVTVQAYARERLAETGRTGDAEARHAEWAGQLGSAPAVRAAEVHTERWQALAAELDNLVVGARRAATADIAARCACAVAVVAVRRGLTALGLELCEAVLARPELSDDGRAWLHAARGELCQASGRADDALAATDRGLAARATGDVGNRLRIVRADVLVRIKHADAESALADAAAGLAECPDAYLEARLEGIRARHRIGLHSDAAGVASMEAAIAAFRSLGAERDEASALGALGRIHVMGPAPDRSLPLLTRALEVAQRIGDEALRAELEVGLGLYWTVQADPSKAEAFLTAGRDRARRCGEQTLEADATDMLGTLYYSENRLDDSAASFRAGIEAFEALGRPERVAHAVQGLGMVAVAQGRFDDACARFTEAAAAMTRDPKNRAVALGNRGLAHQCAGRPAAAVMDFEAALAVHEEMGFTYGTLYWRSALAVLAGDAGDRDAVHAHVRAIDAHCDRYPAAGREALDRVAYAWLALGDPDAAVAALDRRAALGDGAPVPARGWVAALRGDRPAALAVVEAHADAAPGSHTARVVARIRDALGLSTV